MNHNLNYDILAKLQIKFGDDRFMFTKTNLPKLEGNNIDTNEIIVTKMWHHYNDSHRVEMLDVSCTKKQYQILRLLFLDYLFNRIDILINLTNDASIIKKIRIGNKTNNDKKEFGLIQKNIAYNYWTSEISHRYPFQDLKTFPNFNLTNDEDKSMITEADWANRDCLQISGDDDTLAKVAELFLNIGHNDNTLDEIVLETAVGYGGVSHGSVEVRFWLLGSIGYNEN